MWEAKVERRRPPRHFGPDKAVEPYSREKATGCELLRIMAHGKYKEETYLYHIYVKPYHLLLVTNKHVFLRNADDLHKVWSEPLSSSNICLMLIFLDVKPELYVQENRLYLPLKSLDPPQKVIYCTDPDILQNIFVNLMKILIEEQRMHVDM